MNAPRLMSRHRERATLNGVELKYDVHGSGEPIVLMHAGLCADFFAPLAAEPALADRYRVLRYHRVGYAGSSHVDGRSASRYRPRTAAW